MTITIATMRAAGLSAEQIIGVLEKAEAEKIARRREQNRINKQNQRSRQQMRADVADRADNADVVSPPPASPPSMVSPITPSLTPPSSPTPNPQNARARGSRLAEDWQPSESLLRWGGEQGLRLFEIDYQLSKFRDWAASASGPNAIKRDWEAAFRNWLRKSIEDNKRGGNGISKLTTQEAALELARRLGQVPGGNSGPAGGPALRLLSAK